MDALFVPLAESFGASVDQIRVCDLSIVTICQLTLRVQLISCLLLSYPLGSVFVRIQSPTLKHLFNVFVTLFNLLVMLNMFTAFLQLFLDVVVTYLLTRGMKDKRMPWIVFM